MRRRAGRKFRSVFRQGVATDNGVIVATYLTQSFRGAAPRNKAEIRRIVMEAGSRRVRPCLMTTATTFIALLPILTSPGRGADLMIPMALPTVGGISLSLVTLLTVPVLFSLAKELKLVRERARRTLTDKHQRGSGT